MRYGILILLMIMPLFLQAQEIPKKANTIIVKGVNFTEVANKLLDKTYAIDKTDSILKTIKTEPIALKNGTQATFYIRIKDSNAVMYCFSNFAGDSFLGVPIDDMRVANTGINNSFMKKSFNLLKEFALSFNKPVEYLVQ